MNYVRLSNASLKYQRFTPSGCRNIGIRQFEFVAKTQFLYMVNIDSFFLRDRDLNK